MDLLVFFASGQVVRLGGNWFDPTRSPESQAWFEERCGIGEDDCIVGTKMVP